MFPPLNDENLMIKNYYVSTLIHGSRMSIIIKNLRTPIKNPPPPFLNMNFVKKLSTSVDLQP
jgi:hypothetical protein